MPLIIDPGSPSNSNGYTSNYIPSVNTAEICNLPEWSLPTVELPDLPPLNTTCRFDFPNITLIPPIYNTPVKIPLACESFTAGVHVDFSGKATGNFYVAPTSVPNCGFDLIGDINVDVCDYSVNIETIDNIPIEIVTRDEQGQETSTPYALPIWLESYIENCALHLKLATGDTTRIDLGTVAFSVDSTQIASSPVCNDSFDWPHLEQAESGVILAGKLPAPCFSCQDNEAMGDFYYTEAEYKRLTVGAPDSEGYYGGISFDSQCCNNSNAYWSDCGGALVVTDTGRSNVFEMNSETGELSLYKGAGADITTTIKNSEYRIDESSGSGSVQLGLTNGPLVYLIDSNNNAINININGTPEILIDDMSSSAQIYLRTSDLTGEKKEAKLRQVQVCVDDGTGTKVNKSMWILGTEPE